MFFLVKAKKLILNLGNKKKKKTKNKLYYQNLKLYLNLELQLKKIHRILEFKEEPYIEGNTELQR